MPAITDRPCPGSALLLVSFLALAGCSQKTRVLQGPAVPASTSTIVARGAPAAKVIVTIAGVRGGSGRNGAFSPGDHLTVDYRLTQQGGADWRIDEIGIGRALVSGPTFNYQRVIAEQTDVVARSGTNADGSHSYTFDVPIPSAFLPPLNDSPALGPLDGELAGQPLLDGTYTVGLTFAWDYTVEGRAFRSSGEATSDFLLGDNATFASRAVSSNDNCNRCHVDLQAHDGLHHDLTLCLLCHTSGAEDAILPGVPDGTPGETIDARVLFHKLHNGAHLQSVIGIGFTPQGQMHYGATPRRYALFDSAGVMHDYSNARFPAWPNRSIPMPPSQGYSALSAADKLKDDRLRMGVTSCDVCHGDPDGTGPISAPAQGGIAYAQPTRRACASCHDAIDYGITLEINSQSMPPQADDSFCTVCHEFNGGPLAVFETHLHPLLDTIFVPHAPFVDAFNTGLNLSIASLGEASGSDADGTLDPGEALEVQFSLANDAGTAVPASALGSLHAVISGPTSNSNLVLDVDVPRARFSGLPPYTSTLPEKIQLELVGHSTAAPSESFTTSRAPHWHVATALTRVRVRSGTSAVSSSLSSAARLFQNFVDVLDSTGFARDDLVVVDDGVSGAEEYMRVQFVEGNRLWFSSPASPTYASGLRVPHPAGAAVTVVTLVDEAINTACTLDASTGTITELAEFGVGAAVLVDYTCDFRLPARYPVSANSSPDLDDSWGKWAAKGLVDGTYRLALTASRDLTNFGAGGQRVYTIATPPVVRDFLVGSAATSVPYDLIESGSACNACHQDLWFHNGRYRGFDNCIVCHANAGAEDRARYVAANAPASTGVTVNFRTLLHTIHRGYKLADAAAFTAVDAGTAAYPNNFVAENFQHLHFPAQPGDTQQCAKCHGAANQAWKAPAVREHPTEQEQPVRAWRVVCAACHDDTASTAHIDIQTAASGAEACGVCHGVGATYAVELYHEAR